MRTTHHRQKSYWTTFLWFSDYIKLLHLIPFLLGHNRLAFFYRFPIPDFGHEIFPIPDTIRLIGNAYYQELFASSTFDQNLASASLSSEFTCQRELDSYLAEKNQPRTSPPTDPVIYWKSREKTFQLLAAVAKRFCSVPPSSVDSERSFSTAGAICSDKRSNMSAEKTEMLLFLAKNLEVINFDY